MDCPGCERLLASKGVAVQYHSMHELATYHKGACPACMDKRLHTDAEWDNHPEAGKGFRQEPIRNKTEKLEEPRITT